MSVQDAMRFIERVDQDTELRDKIRSGLPDMELEDLVKMGAEAGMVFSVAELRTAFAKDWAARFAYYSARAAE
jgi:predicted ribosomally synthesized peptide with nif11-like leader